MTEFVEFPKISRLSRECVVTEKIDGTNAQITIIELDGYPAENCLYQKDGLALFSGSRTRWITPADDNYGFAKWALTNAEELLLLGLGSHFGEWWGQGIQRNYSQTTKHFSLFNTARWSDNSVRPKCCEVVPTLYRGAFDDYEVMRGVKFAMERLKTEGSAAAPGFMKPEGIVIWHEAARVMFKKTLDKDDEWKGKK